MSRASRSGASIGRTSYGSIDKTPTDYDPNTDHRLMQCQRQGFIVIGCLVLTLLMVFWKMASYLGNDDQPDNQQFCELDLNQTHQANCLTNFARGKALLQNYTWQTQQLCYPTYTYFIGQSVCQTGSIDQRTVCWNAIMNGVSSKLSSLYTRKLANDAMWGVTLVGIFMGVTLTIMAKLTVDCIRYRLNPPPSQQQKRLLALQSIAEDGGERYSKEDATTKQTRTPSAGRK